MSSVLCHLAPPSLYPSFRLEGTADSQGERGRALKYIAAMCGHMNPVSVNRLGTKTAAPRSSLAPDIGNIILLSLPCKKHKLARVLISLRAVSGQWPSLLSLGGGVLSIWVFHEFPFILSRAQPSRAGVTRSPGLT